MLLVKGKGTSRGRVQSKVRIIRSKEDHASFEEGDILVTRLTDPTMVPLMSKASAIVCEIGGLMSHPSIVSRELGIPCVVAAENVTSIVNDGDFIHVCGESGEIHKVDSERWKLKW